MVNLDDLFKQKTLRIEWEKCIINRFLILEGLKVKKSLLAVLAVCCAFSEAKDCSESRSAYEGVYIGAGLSYQYNMHDVWVSDKLRTDIEETFPTTGRETVDSFNRAGNKICDISNHTLNRKNKGKISGSVNAGWGKFVYSNLYLGADLVLDISGKGKVTEIDSLDRGGKGGLDSIAYGSTTVQSNVVVPTLALRVGGYIPDVDALVCVRAGATWVGANAKNQKLENEVKLNKVVPIIGLSVEKNVWKNCSVKLEGDYRFPVSKKVQMKYDKLFKGANVNINEEVKIRGYSLRLMGVYRF